MSVHTVVARGGDPSASADSLQSQQIGSLNEKAAEAGRQLAELKLKYGPRHPAVQIAQVQLANVQRQIKGLTQLIVSATGNRYEAAKKR